MHISQPSKGSRLLFTQAFITCLHADTAVEPGDLVCTAGVWVHGIGLALFRHLKGLGRARLDTGIAFGTVVFLGFGCRLNDRLGEEAGHFYAGPKFGGNEQKRGQVRF